MFIITANSQIQNSEILLVEITKKWGVALNMAYVFVILSAIYTSAICSGYGFAKNISKNEKTYKICTFIICILTIITSSWSFSNSIQIVYPLFGMLGFIQLYKLIKCEK